VDINNQARARGQYIEVVPHSRIVFSFGWEGDEGVPPGSSTVEITLYSGPRWHACAARAPWTFDGCYA
jgi:uncharacterized protein YndB with AHSA1/START domain